jgi:integrase
VLTGVRWGETTALTWAEIEDSEHSHVLRIRRSQVRAVIRNTTKTGKRRLVPFPAELASLLSEHRRTLLATQHPGLLEGWGFPNGLGKPRASGSLCDANRRVLAPAGITKRVTIHRCDARPRVCCAEPRCIRSRRRPSSAHTTDRMRAHYSTNAEDTRDIGTRVASLVPAVRLNRGG